MGVRFVIFVSTILLAVEAFQMTPQLGNFRDDSFVAVRHHKAAPSFALRKSAKLAEMMKLPDVNTQAPAFKLPDANGKLVGLEDFKGKWTVLYFCK